MIRIRETWLREAAAELWSTSSLWAVVCLTSFSEMTEMTRSWFDFRVCGPTVASFSGMCGRVASCPVWMVPSVQRSLHSPMSFWAFHPGNRISTDYLMFSQWSWNSPSSAKMHRAKHHICKKPCKMQAGVYSQFMISGCLIWGFNTLSLTAGSLSAIK